jgi:ApaG protein
MYEAITRRLRVRVVPRFIEEQSNADANEYFWSYTIDVINEGQETVQLKSRYWRITDGAGRIEEIRGPGVVGETPVLKPGTSYRYTSGCPLSTPSGIMVGQFFMTTADGEAFAIDVPAFSLDSPHGRRALN